MISLHSRHTHVLCHSYRMEIDKTDASIGRVGHEKKQSNNGKKDALTMFNVYIIYVVLLLSVFIIVLLLWYYSIIIMNDRGGI